MRRSLLVLVLSLAGCDVATRNQNEFEFLVQVEELIDEEDRCGLYVLVTGRPRALVGSDPLAVEFRRFISASRVECRFGSDDSGDGESAPFPDAGIVEMARGEGVTPRDEQAPLADFDAAPGSAVGGRSNGDDASFDGRTVSDRGRDERENDAPGTSTRPEGRDGGFSDDDDDDGGHGDDDDDDEDDDDEDDEDDDEVDDEDDDEDDDDDL